MKIAVTGATGFIGKGLIDFLIEENNRVIALSRNPGRARSLLGNRLEAIEWSFNNMNGLLKELDNSDAIVNLAGENIGSSIWTKNKRKKIKDSRVKGGQLISELIRLMKNPPQVLIQASAVGYYGTRGEEILTENSEGGSGFLPEVAREWEKSTAAVETSGVRCVIIRSGVVLSSGGGAFPKLASSYKYHTGTMLGSGRQWMPWIHYEDEINAIYFLIKNSASSGIYNLVAPVPARMTEVCKQIGPTLFRIPKSLVKLFLGKLAEETILVSQRVVPERLSKDGFQFKFKTVEEAVADIRPKN
ncbi:MAG TPA: TIGR01777 family oxidoreductase [Candidatus Acidoferrales bacterium]|nr:TIGR01777 family oxidoreductase [Candidatus Acidoferrales bacterium]